MSIQQIKALVMTQFQHDQTGHGVDHLERVLSLALAFARQEKANLEMVSIIALLHDVDDYKLVGIEAASLFLNSKKIMRAVGLDSAFQQAVISQIKTIGYSKYLEGVRPTTLEGKIVSDADMCDAIGANGLLRVYAYGRSKGQPFFNRDVFPNFITDAKTYRQQGSHYTIHHFFDKLLKLKNLMLTQSGKKEAKERHEYMVDFLKQFFKEENTPEWQRYLNEFLKKN